MLFRSASRCSTRPSSPVREAGAAPQIVASQHALTVPRSYLSWITGKASPTSMSSAIWRWSMLRLLELGHRKDLPDFLMNASRDAPSSASDALIEPCGSSDWSRSTGHATESLHDQL